MWLVISVEQPMHRKRGEIDKERERGGLVTDFQYASTLDKKHNL